MSKKTYQILVSSSTGIYFDVQANSKDEAIDLFNDGEDCGDGYDEYDVESYVVEAREKEMTDG